MRAGQTPHSMSPDLSMLTRPAPSHRKRLALVGHRVAGIETQFRNVATVAASMPELEALPVPISPFKAGDLLERHFAFLSPATRGTLRTLAAASAMFGYRRLDGVWTQVDVSLMPWLVAGALGRQAPVLYTLDSTPRLLRQLGPHYQMAVTRSAVKRAAKDLLMRNFYRRVALFNPWSEWAAASLRDDYGIQESRIEVLSPGVDVAYWCPLDASAEVGPLRLLFVGGDFKRKGGDLLLAVYMQQLRGRVELDLVTRERLPDLGPGVRVHNDLSANDERLRELYRRAQVFVLPTRADCYSMAALEAMASSLPVIISPVGGIRGILDHGREGLYVRPDDGAGLTDAIRSLIDNRERRRAMAAAARALAVRRYDAALNTRRLFQRLLERSGDARPLEQG